MKENRPSLTLLNNPALPASVQQRNRFLLSPSFRILLLFMVCTMVLASTGYYVTSRKQEVVMTNNTCVAQSCIEPVKTKREDRAAIGHIFWESITRLIISAKS